MSFRDDAARETAAHAQQLHAAWSARAAHQLETLRHAIDDAARAAAAALAERPCADDDDGIRPLIDRLEGSAEAWAKAAGEQEATTARVRIDALMQELHDASADRTRLGSLLQEALAQVEALESSLADTSKQLTTAREDLARIRTAFENAEASRRDLERELQEATTRHAAVQSERDAVRDELERARADAAHLTAALQAELDEAVSASHAARTLQETTEAARLRLEERLKQAAERAADVERRRVEEVNLRRELQTKFDSTMEDKAALEQRLNEAEGRESESLARLADAASIQARLEGQLRAERAAAAEFRSTIDAAEARVRSLQSAAQGELQAAQADFASRLARERENTAALRVELDAAQRRLAESAPGPALSRLRHGLQALDRCDESDAMLDVLMERLAADFARVALFIVRDNRLEGRSSRGFAPTTDITNIAVPLSIASPLTQAVTERDACAVAAENAVSLFGGPASCALALPIIVPEAVVAVAYVEQPPEHHSAETAQHAARILVDHASRLLASRQKRVAPPVDPGSATSLVAAETAGGLDSPIAYPGPVRQADRVKMPAGVKALVDGHSSTLVDLSTSGAQILAPRVLRPNQAVRLQLAVGDGTTIPCLGRVVWVWFELPSPQAEPRYRAGIVFTEADRSAVEVFLGQSVAAARTEDQPHTGTGA